MDLHALIPLLLLSLISLRSPAVAAAASVLFIEPHQRFIRSDPLRSPVQANTVSTDEVAAAVSVLLGFAPSDSLSAESSAKLNEVLLPNPFSRPRAVFVLEVVGVDGDFSTEYSGSRLEVVGSTKADIHLANEDEVSVVALDGDVGVDCDEACIEKELSGLARLVGGSYVGGVESRDAEMRLPLANDGSLILNMEKKADRRFAVDLVSLVRNINKAVEMHEDFGGTNASPAELIIGRFTAIQDLKEEYGSGDMVRKGEELFQTILTKSLELLQKSYEGKIVGVVLSTSEPNSESEALFDVKFATQVSRRLAGITPGEIVILEVLLVRKSLALITGLILLVSTLIGVYYLINMPLTRDTLLYSNVKLD